MKIPATIAIVLLAFSSLVAADRPKPPAGFRWRDFPEVYCALQVPVDWHAQAKSAGLTKIIVVSPEKSAEQGFDTGFTMQSVYCKSSQDWKEAMEKSGSLMKAARDAIEKPIVSKIDRTDDMLYMVVEGVRKVPGAKQPDRLYHVRNVVRAFPKNRIVYVYSFGALAEDWDSAWTKGQVVFGAIEFALPE